MSAERYTRENKLIAFGRESSLPRMLSGREDYCVASSTHAYLNMQAEARDYDQFASQTFMKGEN